MIFLYNKSKHCLEEQAGEKPKEPHKRDYELISLGGLVYEADLKNYLRDLEIYNGRLASLRTFPCAPGTNWEEGKEYREGDFEVKKFCEHADNCLLSVACISCNDVAFPLSKDSSDDELWEEFCLNLRSLTDFDLKRRPNSMQQLKEKYRITKK